MNTQERGYVYCLIDPQDARVFYVGSTNNPAKRFRQHTSPKNKSAVGDYISSLRERGLSPIMAIIEECYPQTRVEREYYWIGKIIEASGYPYPLINNSLSPAEKYIDHNVSKALLHEKWERQQKAKLAEIDDFSIRMYLEKELSEESVALIFRFIYQLRSIEGEITDKKKNADMRNPYRHNSDLD